MKDFITYIHNILYIVIKLFIDYDRLNPFNTIRPLW
jgi:hypothetical protein